MGEIAEMMLEGFMCERCGEVIGDLDTGEGQGFPGLCAGCAQDEEDESGSRPAGKPIACGDCSRRFASEAALAQHRAAKHK